MKKLIILIFLVAGFNTTRAQHYRGFGSDDYPKFRIGLQGGWSYRTAKISDQVPPEFRSYIKGLKSGYHYGADASYFLTRSLGLGIKYSGFGSSNSASNVLVTDPLTKKSQVVTMSDDISMHYIGPALNSRYLSQNEFFQFISTVSIGYLSYTDDVVLVSKSKMKSSTLGLVCGIGGDFAVHQNIYVGVEISGMLGSLNYYDIETNAMSQRVKLEEDQRESVSRVDVSAGVRFNF
jgi:opacity protein-like surface antigen